MPDIRHRVGVAVPQQRVYEMFSTKDGLAKFWTREIEGDSEIGGKLSFFFGHVDPSPLRSRRSPSWRRTTVCSGAASKGPKNGSAPPSHSS